MPLPAATAEALGRTFVNAGTYGFLLAVASRDVFFSVATYLAFWLAILAPIDYAAFIATGPLAADVTLFVASAFLVVPAAATLAAMVGIGFVKLFEIGQLIDVWLTGSGGVSDEEERNLPLLVYAVVLAFTGTLLFFGYEPSTSAAWLYGLATPTLGFWLLVLAILFGVLAIVAVGCSAAQRKMGTRYENARDYMSTAYAFLLLLVVAVTELVTHFGLSSPSVQLVDLWWLLAILAVDGVFLVGGYLGEKAAAKSLAAPAWQSRGRFYMLSGSEGVGCVNFFRVVVFLALHVGLFWTYGTWLRYYTGDDVVAMLGWPNYLLAYAIGLGIIIVAFVFYSLWCRWPASEKERLLGEGASSVKASAPRVPVQQQATALRPPAMSASSSTTRRRPNHASSSPFRLDF